MNPTSCAATPHTSEASLRRTTHPNTGRHPNLYHLPQAVGSSAIGTTDSLRPVLSGSAVFRPWQGVPIVRETIENLGVDCSEPQ